MVHECGVRGCKKSGRRHPGHRFFLIPKDPELRAKWLSFAGVQKAGKDFRICMDHFEPNCIYKRHPRRLLARNSIPNIKPGSTSTNESVNLISHAEPEPLAIGEDNSQVSQLSAIGENISQVSEPSTTAENNFQVSEEVTRTFPSQDMKAHATMDTIVKPREPRLENAETPGTPQRGGLSRDTKVLTPKSLRIRTQKRTILALRSKVTRLKNNRIVKLNQDSKLSKCKAEKLIEISAPLLSNEARILFQTQLSLARLNKYGKRYSDEMKDISLSILYHSPKAYRFLQKFLNLPSARTLRTYQAQFPVYPGFNVSALKTLKEKFNHTAQADKLVSLLFDEVILTSEVHFDPPSDKFFGFADDGTLRQPDVAKSALVAMISWINQPLKQVIGYFFLASANNSELTHTLILESIDKVFAHGLIVKTVIFDQGPRNQGFLSAVGISAKKPYFFRENTKIFVIYDPPHLLKSLRNNWKEKLFHYKNGIASWAEVVQVFQLSQENPLNLIPKISKRHFDLNKYSKMRVSLAVQILSESMYTAHLVYRTMFPEKFGSDDTTSQLIIDLDKTFDSLNSSFLRKTVPNKLNYAMSKNSGHAEFLRDIAANFEKARFEGRKVPCVQGLVITINAVLQLFDDLVENYSIQHLCTRRLNQDPLENLFATIRQQHGCSQYPSPMQFETGIRHILITHLTKISNSANCESDRNNVSAKLSSIKHIQTDTAHLPLPIAEVKISDADLSECLPETETQEFTESNAIYYICGYLIKKFLMTHKCVKCKHILSIADDTSYADHKLFTIMKTYADTNGLLHAAENVFRTILAWERHYKSVIRSIVHASNITTVVERILKETCTPLDLCSAESSRAFMLLFIRVRSHWEARFLRRELKEGGKVQSAAQAQHTDKKIRKFGTKKVQRPN